MVLPYARVGVIGGVMLALGRALGETMAVTFVIGNAHRISASLLAPGTTISATIANEFTEAVGDLYTSSLIELGLILFVITFFVLASRGTCCFASSGGPADGPLDFTLRVAARNVLAAVASYSATYSVSPGCAHSRRCCSGKGSADFDCSVHRNDAAARRGRRAAQRDRRQL